VQYNVVALLYLGLKGFDMIGYFFANRFDNNLPIRAYGKPIPQPLHQIIAAGCVRVVGHCLSLFLITQH